MSKVGIIYHSATNTTHQLANAIAEGCSSTKAEVTLFRINDNDIQSGRYRNTSFLAELSLCDGIIFGSPTYMGSVSSQFKAFADATSELWAEQAWQDKFAAGFTIGLNYSGDQLNTIQYFQIFSAQHGMIWVSLDMPGGINSPNHNRLGAQSGLIAQTSSNDVNALDLSTARYLGERFGRLINKYKGNTNNELWRIGQGLQQLCE